MKHECSFRKSFIPLCISIYPLVLFVAYEQTLEHKGGKQCNFESPLGHFRQPACCTVEQNIFKVASDLGGGSPDQELPGGGKRKEVNLLPGTGKEQQNILII